MGAASATLQKIFAVEKGETAYMVVAVKVESEISSVGHRLRTSDEDAVHAFTVVEE